MPARDDHGMPRTCRVGVTGAERQFVLYRHPTRICAK
jgi:hypothetical protein